jgi:hypothetical protein
MAQLDLQDLSLRKLVFTTKQSRFLVFGLLRRWKTLLAMTVDAWVLSLRVRWAGPVVKQAHEAISGNIESHDCFRERSKTGAQVSTTDTRYFI